MNFLQNKLENFVPPPVSSFQLTKEKLAPSVRRGSILLPMVHRKSGIHLCERNLLRLIPVAQAIPFVLHMSGREKPHHTITAIER